MSRTEIWTHARRTMVRLMRGVALLAVLAVFFMVTAAPGGGGGGGGFGGGGGGGAVYSGAGYGGGGGRDSGNVDPRTLLAVLAGMGAIGALALFGGRPRIVHLIVHLRTGQRYVPGLDALLTGGDFDTPLGRKAVLSRIGGMIDPSDVVEGVVRVSGKSARADERTGTLCREQMQRAGLRDMAHVGTMHSAPSGPRVREGDACVLGIVFTVMDLFGFPSGDVATTVATLERLGKDRPTPGSLYLYYAPDPGEPLDAAAAARMFAVLRAGAEAGSQTQPSNVARTRQGLS